MTLDPAHFEDRLMTTLLAEEIGREDCPDLTADILAEAFPRPAVFNWRIGAGVAAAAALLVVVVSFWPEPRAVYTPVAVKGQVTVEGGGPIARGSYLHAAESSAELILGGYGHVTLTPGTRVQVQGEEKNEAVELLTGQVICEVNSGVGRFQVLTPLGTVDVKGTRFSVELTEDHSEQLRTEKGEPAMIKQQMWVKVLSGVVVLSGLVGEPRELKAGEEQKIAGGTVTGTVVEKGKNTLVLRVGEGEKTVELFPRWIGDAKGGLDERMLKMFEQVPVGSLIKARVAYDERLRALDLRIVKAGEGRREKEEPGKPDLDLPGKEKRDLEEAARERKEAAREREEEKPRLKPEPEHKGEIRPLPPQKEAEKPAAPVRPEPRREGAEKERPAPAGEAERIEARVQELKKHIELGRQKVREAAKAGRERDAEKMEKQVHELEKEVENLVRRLRENAAQRREAGQPEAPKREAEKRDGGAEAEKARRIRELEKELEELKRKEGIKPVEKREEFKPVRK